MNFAIWAAVSRKDQAANDKVSMETQETHSRAFALTKGWHETAGPYLIPGASRSFYVNLSDAEADIPQLSEMLNAAQVNRFDVLVFYSYDRLGDLADMIAQTLRFYGVQLLSLSQGVEVLPPDQFDPYTSDAETNMRTMARMTQQFRIADLRRKFRSGVTGRVDKGLHSLRIPYGYTKGPERVSIQVPAQAQVIIEIKQLFLHGQSYYDIMHQLDAQGLPTPQAAQCWSHTTIKKILLNPFYAGKVFFGRRRVMRDPRDNSMRLVSNPHPHLADGKHQSLYSWDDYQTILSEIERRDRLPRNNRYQFSGLLICSICGAHLTHGKQNTWRCKGTGHVKVTHQEALAIIPRSLQKALQDVTPALHPPPAPASASILQDLTRQRRRIQSAYESEVYSLAEADEKIKGIDLKIDALKNEENHKLRKRVSHQQFLATLEDSKEIIADTPQWINHDDPRRVNLLLHRIVRQIVITPSLQVTVHLMD